MSQGNDASPQRVEEMFDRISGVYDIMNLLISGFQEPRWRRRAVRATRLAPGGRALDVACGTGTVTRDLFRVVQPGGSVIGVDASVGMIDRARAHWNPTAAFELIAGADHFFSGFLKMLEDRVAARI